MIRLPFVLEPRPEPSVKMKWLAPVLAIACTLIVGFIVFLALGRNPVTAFQAFFIEPISTKVGISELLLKASPLCLIALGLACGYRAGVWNIGAEGQLIMGGIFAGTLAIQFDGSTSPLLLPCMILAGAIGGGLWAAIPAFLRTKFNANEILVSLMLTYIAGFILSYLIHGPLRDPAGLGFPQSIMFKDASLFSPLLEGTRVNTSLILTIVAIPLVWFFLNKSFVGYQMKVGGMAPQAARYAGFSAKRSVWLGLLAGGVAAGIAGMAEVSGPLGQLQPTLSPGYGFAAIIVAFIGRLHPVGIAFGALLMSLLYLGGESAQMNLSLPSAITGLFQGLLLLFLLGSDVFINFKLRLRK